MRQRTSSSSTTDLPRSLASTTLSPPSSPRNPSITDRCLTNIDILRSKIECFFGVLLAGSLRPLFFNNCKFCNSTQLNSSYFVSINSITIVSYYIYADCSAYHRDAYCATLSKSTKSLAVVKKSDRTV